MVSALIGLQLGRVREPQARQALESARLRVATIAQTQRRMRLSEDLESTQIDEVLNEIVHDACDSLAMPSRLKVVCQFAPLSSARADAVSLSVIVNELLTNAVKHAYPHQTEGTIRLEFGLNAENQPEVLVADDGIGIAAGPETEPPGLGAMIVERLSQQYNGTIAARANEPTGTVIRVRLPRLRTQTVPQMAAGH